MNDSTSYQLVFDVARTGYRHWLFSAAGLPIAVAGFLELVRANATRRRLGLVLVLAGVAWTSFAFLTSYHEYTSLRDALATGRFQIVEGPVQHVVPGDGRTPESFDVRGHRYTYSWSVVSAGFNSPGIVQPGRTVRIADVGGQIARLEISR